MLEAGTQEARHVLDHDCFRPAFLNHPEGGWKQIPLIRPAKPISGNGEGRAGQTYGNEINVPVILRGKGVQVCLQDIPVRPVHSEGGASMGVHFDEGPGFEASLFQAEGLPTGPSAKFQGFEASFIHPLTTRVPFRIVGSSKPASELTRIRPDFVHVYRTGMRLLRIGFVIAAQWKESRSFKTDFMK